MANDFVNTITTKDGTIYNVQDKRLEVTAADAGKVVSVDNNGNLTLSEPSAGTQLYLHTIPVENGMEVSDTLVVLSTSPTPATADSEIITLINNQSIMCKLGSYNCAPFAYDSGDGYVGLRFYSGTSGGLGYGYFTMTGSDVVTLL